MASGNLQKNESREEENDGGEEVGFLVLLVYYFRPGLAEWITIRMGYDETRYEEFQCVLCFAICMI